MDLLIQGFVSEKKRSIINPGKSLLLSILKVATVCPAYLEQHLQAGTGVFYLGSDMPASAKIENAATKVGNASANLHVYVSII